MKGKIAALLAGVAIGSGVPAGYALTQPHARKPPAGPVVVSRSWTGEPVIDIKSLDLTCFYWNQKDAQNLETPPAGLGPGNKLYYDHGPALDCQRLSVGPDSRSMWITRWHYEMSDQTGASYVYHAGRTP
jgi:hypothetical protein